METCSISDCGEPIKARGYCPKHYFRLWRGKNPEDPTWYERHWTTRFFAKVSKSGGFPDFSDPLIRVRKEDGECWAWGTGVPTMYGTFHLNGKLHKAYRVSYELFRGKLEKGQVVDHLCRVPNCVNPDHLEAVSHKENIMRGNIKKKGA